mmetsp:Transcript_10379/g.47590  ORF Transcript_10379/g.47590 Transcript_10379/m.47590 type:complete len:371 (+) Transcript_10379:2230-3342(+)
MPVFVHPAQTFFRVFRLEVTQDGDVEDAADVRFEKRRGQQQRHGDDVVEKGSSLAEVLELFEKLGKVERRDGHEDVLDHAAELNLALLHHRLLLGHSRVLFSRVLFVFLRGCDGARGARRASRDDGGQLHPILILLLLRARVLGRIGLGDLNLGTVRRGDRGGGLLRRQEVMPALQQALHAGDDYDRDLVPHLPPEPGERGARPRRRGRLFHHIPRLGHCRDGRVGDRVRVHPRDAVAPAGGQLIRPLAANLGTLPHAVDERQPRVGETDQPQPRAPARAGDVFEYPAELRHPQLRDVLENHRRRRDGHEDQTVVVSLVVQTRSLLSRGCRFVHFSARRLYRPAALEELDRLVVRRLLRLVALFQPGNRG